MLAFFGSDEKLDKAGIQMKAQDSLEFEQASLMSNYLIYTVVGSLVRKKIQKEYYIANVFNLDNCAIM